MFRTTEADPGQQGGIRHDCGERADGPAYKHGAFTSLMLRRSIDGIFQHESINFFLTNLVARRQLTRLMGWFSRVEQPLVRDLSIGAWKLFAGGLDLHDAKKTQFSSLHDCFIRELRPGARPVDPSPGVLVSPCDAIVGASGRICGTTLIQAKGFDYTLQELLLDSYLTEQYRNGSYATLRLTSTMYHRFHAPEDADVNGIQYVAGDTWNVNPVALKRVPRLFCRNERAIVPMTLRNSSDSITLVAVGAILVASIRLHFLDVPLNLRYPGPNRIACRVALRRGEEMGYFEHGSTIVVLATSGLLLAPSIREGHRIRAGEPLLNHGARPGTPCAVRRLAAESYRSSDTD